MKRQHRKPAWRKVRIPVAPPGRRHGDASKYNRQYQPNADELLEEYDDDDDDEDEEEARMFVRKCKEYCFETFDQMLPIVLGLTLGFFVMAPIFEYAKESIYPKIGEAWSMAWHLGETARVVKMPSDDLLAEILEEAGFDVSKTREKGQLRFTSGPWTAMMYNEGFRIKLSVGFASSKVSADDVNNWNQRYMYTKMYLDNAGIPFLQSYMYLGADGVSREALVGFCEMYGDALDNFAGDRLKGALTELFGGDDGDKANKSQTQGVRL